MSALATSVLRPGPRRLALGLVAMGMSIYLFRVMRQEEASAIPSVLLPFRRENKDHLLSFNRRINELRAFWKLCNRRNRLGFDLEELASTMVQLGVQISEYEVQELWKRITVDERQELVSFPQLSAAVQKQWEKNLSETDPLGKMVFEKLTVASVFALRYTGHYQMGYIAAKQEEVQEIIQRTVQRQVDLALDGVGNVIRENAKDPDMPLFLQRTVDETVDMFLPDIKLEILRRTGDFLSPRRRTRSRRVRDVITDSVVERQERGILSMLRAFILYHLFPYDASIWQCFKNPIWVTFTVIGILPGLSQAWWLLIFFIHDKSNEHQLCQFIISFKSVQFLNLGIWQTLVGVMRYMRCTTMSSSSCEKAGPSLSYWDTNFFIVQILLVWIAFLMLPYSKSNDRRDRQAYGLSRRVRKDWFGNQIDITKGGHLMKLFWYETAAVCLVFGLALLSSLSGLERWKLTAILFWIRTLYGLLSLPFVPFRVPIIATLLTHTRPHGYNEFGETVPSKRRRRRREEDGPRLQ